MSSLQSIEREIFPSIERYNSMCKSSERLKVTNSVSSLAANVADDGKGQRICVLCRTSEMKPDHAIYKYSRFLTPSAKLQRLKEIDGRFKCGYLNHALFH